MLKVRDITTKSLQKAGLFGVAFYRAVLSPYLGGQCRFTPSCSEYTRQAIARHGLAWGVLRGAVRLFRCTFWLGRGYAPLANSD